MPTSKKRINISLPEDVENMIKILSSRDDVPQATKALHLIQLAIEIDEDELWNAMAEKRDTKKASFLSHKEAWK
ncbi:hypothetical protein KKC44_04715 [Patescibacteria group bacterium]|nr:hypothetical protein [Patescibacteria group bacterium]